MAASYLQESSGLNGAAIQRGLEHGSKGTAIVRSRYQATTSEDTSCWN
jgi:hypothetical protein